MDTMMADNIEKTDKSLEERGLPADSFFDVVFEDGSTASERWMNWSQISDERRVEYFGMTKTVFVSRLPVKRIVIRHGDLETTVDVPAGCEAYQGVRSETMLLGGKKESRVLGRIVGIIKDGEVIEERFLNGIQHEVQGTRN